MRRASSRASTTSPRSSSTQPPRGTRRSTPPRAGTWPMVDQLTKAETPQAPKPRKKQRRPLETYNRTWLGIIAVAVVAVLIGAMLIVKVADVGYRQYTARFQQAAALKAG